MSKDEIMKTTIEIDTEDLFEITNIVNIIGSYLEKKEIPFDCIGYTKCDSGKQYSIVRVGKN